MPDPIRLDKRVAEVVQCSREHARRYIDGGWITVDGEVVEDPRLLVTGEAIELAANARLDPIEPATMLVNKPAGTSFAQVASLVAPETRSPDDESAIRVVARHFHGLTPLMPLDREASGLIVVSQDGRACRRLTEDHGQIEQEFVVGVTGAPSEGALDRLAFGLRYQARVLPPCKVSWQSETRLRFAIKAVQPGQLRHMCHMVGLEVVDIRRIRIGRVPLRKLPESQWRYLPVGERF